ncbi:MAG: DUF4840 domain-containing protein [Prevotella copri]|nr:DUF4840 domain-containing protein [Segatella copri]
MKKIKLFSIAAAFVAAFAFTSCNTGDDNNSYYQPLTQAEKQICYVKTAGSRMNKLAYMSDEHVTEIKGNKEYIDTLDVATDIYGNGKDTVMTVHNFPVKIFARYIPESADTKELKEALKKYEMPVNFKSVVYYLTVTPVIQFMLFPDAITVNLEYGGATHKVKFYCYSSGNSRYTFGQVTQDKSKVEAYLVVYGYEVDPKDEKKPNPTAFNFNMAGTQLSNGTQIKFFEP